MVILLADDDRKIRFCLKSMLADIVPGNCRILEAGNGREMIERCELYHPDIAFTDIDMPYLNGLSAIEECCRLSPATQFVVLTGYPTFSFAQKCVSLPVTDYILKPIEFSKLKELMEKLAASLSSILDNESDAFQLRLSDCFSLWDEIGTEQREVQPEPHAHYCGFVFFIDCAGRTDDYPRLYKQLLLAVKSVGEEFVQSRQVYGVCNSKEGALRAVFKKGSRGFPEIIRRLATLCSGLSSWDRLVSCLYAEAEDLLGLYLACERIEANQFMRFSYPPSGVNPLPETIPHDAGLFFSGLSDLIAAFLEADELRYKNIADRLCRISCGGAWDLSLSYAARFVYAITRNEISNGSPKDFCRALIDMGGRIYEGKGRESPDMIDRLKQYIARNYMNDISVNVLAGIFNLTPNYLSRLFHEKAGVKFIDYLTEVRVANAKRILTRNDQVSVKDVSIMVGYYSPRHFSKIFQEHTGCNPSEFRKSLR